MYATPIEAIVSGVRRLRGQAPAARSFGVSQPTVWRWVNGHSPVTDTKVLVVEAATGVSRHDLRPDLYPRDAAPSAPVSASHLGQLEPAR